MAELLEREAALNLLATAFAAASAGAGRTVLVSGEAGIGKTSLVTHFLGRLEKPARIFGGGCEAHALRWSRRFLRLAPVRYTLG